ncbi:uncharacterized protein SYNPCC7002_A0175-like [Paramacrobiotus metropolitanus]|uniref:uncharacterized protein SYNPCC7002_A0175-like n=1 Tax=Paramacrobiotus metropolitanus TaxID=2943436 RepID=UPI00244650A0|nr:uncharacterized protein SYNPCC7002_A0175-like [Paramacrobiotus metropolitanus]
MRYHILNQRKDRADLKDELVFETLAGHGLTGRFINYDGYSKNVQLYNDAEISSFDHEATNGVIHTLNNVVGHIQSGTLLDIAKEREELSEILKAIDAAGLTDLLTGAIPASTPLTFAAPTNDAIKKLPGGTWDALLNNRTQLTDVLQYHFASAGTWMTRGLVDKLKVETLNKKANWTVSFDSQNAIKIDDASIVFGDLSATNGVVHIIDGVLLPHPKTNR